MQIAFTGAATRQWLGLSADIRRRIEARLETFAKTGRGDVKRLKGRPGARLRAGDWRVIFYVDGNTLVVAAVGHRREICDWEATMNKVQFIKTVGGEELAVLPKREYERLSALARGEDAGTARIVREARAAVAVGKEVVLPKAIVERLAAGENPIAVLRDWRGETQGELAVRVGITQGYLSDLEAGKRKGPLALHQKFARALGVPLSLLLPVSVSNEEAEPKRFAKRSRLVKERQAQQKRARGTS